MFLNRLCFSFFLLYTLAFVIPLPGDRGYVLNTYFPIPTYREINTSPVTVVKNKTIKSKELDELDLYGKSIKKIYSANISRKFLEYIKTVSSKNQLDYNLVIGLIAAESSFNNSSVSHVGAVGFAQVWPKWHQDKIAGRDILDPYVNVEVGVRYLKECIDKTGQLYEGLACYNGSNSKASADRYYNKVMGRKHTLQITNLELAGI